MSKEAKLFLDYVKENHLLTEDGFTIRDIFFEELKAAYPEVDFHTKNGGSWYRKSDAIFNGYNVEAIKEKDINRNIGLRLCGYDETKKSHRIPKGIGEEIRKKVCVHTGLSVGIECDHKDGRYQKAPEELTIQDFQPLCRGANELKRGKCVKCRNTGKRYNARELGYAIGWIEGNEDYAGTCAGCYWGDVLKFKFEISNGR